MRLTRLLAACTVAAASLATACSGGGDTGTTSTSSATATTTAADKGTEGTELTVLGAASTRVLNEDIQAMTRNKLTFVNAGSSDLVQQLRDGAPGDLLITADQKTMDDAVASGVAEDPKVVATNSMVLVVPRDNPAKINEVADVQREGVNLVVCDTQVPCGAVTQKLAGANGLDLHPASMEHSVSDTLGKVVSGEADAAFVYRTDAASAGDAVTVIEIPHADEFPNSLVAAVATQSRHREQATALRDELGGAEMAKVWSEHGFTPSR